MSDTDNPEPKDLVTEARELLRLIDGAIERITSGRVPMSIPAKQGDPDLVLGNCKLSVSSLCSEVEEQRRLNQTQAESIVSFQEQAKLMREAIEAAIPWLTMEIKERECSTHDQPTHCVDCSLRHAARAVKDQLQAALSPR